MCTSFVTRKRGNTQPRTNKKMYDSFRDTENTKSFHLEGLNLFDLEPKSMKNLNKRARQNVVLVKQQHQEKSVTCHNQKGKWQQW